MNEKLKQEISKLIEEQQKEMFWSINKMLDDRMRMLNHWIASKIDENEKEER
jgi:hypothetical protein